MNLSIVIPAYQVEHYIGTTLGSLQRQTAADFEVLVIDDGSTDGSGEAAERHFAGLPAARLIRTSNGGVSRARNAGLAEARGDYVLFLDGDDYVDERLVEKIAEATGFSASGERPPDAVVWRFVEVAEDGSVQADFFQGKPPLPKRLNGPDVLKRIFFDRNLRIHTAGIAYRRELLTEATLGYEPGCVNGEDQEFIYKALCRAEDVRFIDESLLCYVQRGSSVTYTYNVRKFDFADAFARTALELRTRNHPELDRIAAVLEGPYLLEDYLYTIRTCLEGGNGRISALMRDIETHYPGLHRRMKERIRTCRAQGIPLPRSLRLFAASPAAYALLLRTKRSAALRGRTERSAGEPVSIPSGAEGEGPR
ncbi:glycosyltransferase family 2 protein [Saccharibacillus qingshengii]|uniref:glycosyltransferase family 2 protein n=1 Tax=Saccharibacillus qingshengii TaxID=1763540 RepID=UPI001555B4A2|nr:glycosyltransferase [Saccharibacillus qingshengii]